MSTYKPWLKPVQTNFQRLDWRQAEAFLKEFVGRIPERIAALESHITSTPGFEHWRADGSGRSFADLGPWLMQVLERRELKPSEKVFVPMNPALSPETIERLDESVKSIPMWDLTPRSEALLVDVGMYMADRLHRAFPTTKWIRCKAKHDIWFNFPLLGTVTNGGFNPIMIPINSASQMFDGQFGPDRFGDAYEIWSRIAAKTEPKRAKWSTPNTKAG